MEDTEKMPVLHVEEAQLEDIPAIGRVQRDTWLATYPNEEHGITIEDIEKKDFESPERLERWKKSFTEEREKRRGWVIKNEQGTVVGFCTAIKEAEYNKLGAIYILPEFQQRGMGKVLFEQAAAWLGREKDIALDVVTYNQNAQAFYTRLGFQKWGDTPDADLAKLPSGKTLPEVRMVLRAKI